MPTLHPPPIQALKLRVTQGLTTYYQDIPSSVSGNNNSFRITNADILTAFNNEPVGTIFTPSIVATYAPGTFTTGNVLSTPSVSNFVPKQIATTLSLSQTSLTRNTFDDDFLISLHPNFFLSSLITITSNNPTGVLSFSSSEPQIASINSSSGLVNLLTGGTTTITIGQGVSSDNDYAEATPVYLTLQVDKVVPLITVEDIPDKTPSDAPFELVCISLSSGTFSFSSSDISVVDVDSEGEVTINGSGEATINVEQAASPDGVWAPAGPVSKTVTVLEPGPAISLAENGVTIQYNRNANTVPDDRALFIQANPRGTGLEWFAVVKNNMRSAINDYARGTDNTKFCRILNDPSTLIPFNNIVTTHMTEMYSMFFDAQAFDQDISGWDVSSATNTSYMFTYAFAFNRPLNSWNVSNVTNMQYMFFDAQAFDQDISGWNVSAVTNMNTMFRGALAFDQPIGSWNVSAVTDMQSMFKSASAFDQPLNSWNVSAVTDMQSMFQSASAFDQPIGSWNVSSVTSMRAMFQSASAFNQPLNLWNVSAVTNMQYMFLDNNIFDQPINTNGNSWNVSKVENMNGMFYNSIAFNRPLNLWNTSAVKDMGEMFYSASTFDQDISGWVVDQVTNFVSFREVSALSTPNTPLRFVNAGQ
jgi:surface protein